MTLVRRFLEKRFKLVKVTSQMNDSFSALINRSLLLMKTQVIDLPSAIMPFDYSKSKRVLKSIHYKRRAFSIFTSQKSNTFVEKIQNIIGMAGV